MINAANLTEISKNMASHVLVSCSTTVDENPSSAEGHLLLAGNPIRLLCILTCCINKAA